MDEDFNLFKEFYTRIRENNSRLYKIKILEEYKNEEAIRWYLNFIYNPFKVTGISRKKLSKQLDPKLIKEKTVRGMLEYILEHNTGTDEIISQIYYFEFLYLAQEDIELFEALVAKNIQMGVDVITINTVMPGLIPTFNVMLANKYFDKPEVVEGKSFTITTKIDGGRILAIKKDGIVKFYTRAGQEYEGLVDIKKELESIPLWNFVLDGEITLLDKGNLTSKEQYKETMKITRKDGEKHGVKILAFDLLSYTEFEKQLMTSPYKQRRHDLELIFSGLKYVEVLPALYSGTDTSKIAELLNQQTRKGEEGIMINLNDEPYSFKRSNALLKVKKMQDVDLPIIRVEEGTNQNAGKLGAFVVLYKNNEVRVGSGISKELREKVWKDRASYIGLTITVQYFEETTNADGGVSLRFPVFIDFRYDK